MTVNVTTRQFAFEFSYPTRPGKQVVSPVLYLPEGQPVVFKLRSLDVIHSFFVPSFSEKLDAVPGIVTTLRVTPERLGTYPVECTELCGAGHSLMRTQRARGRRPAAFADWLKSQPLNGPPPVGTPPPNVNPGGPGLRSSGRRLLVVLEPAAVLVLGDRAPRARAPPRARRCSPGSAGCSGCHTLAAAGRHRDGRAEPRHQAEGRLRAAGLPEGPRHDASAVHRDRDHQALRLPAERLQRRDHALELLPASDPGRDPGARQLPGAAAAEMSRRSPASRRGGIVQAMDSGSRREALALARIAHNGTCAPEEVD